MISLRGMLKRMKMPMRSEILKNKINVFKFFFLFRVYVLEVLYNFQNCKITIFSKKKYISKFYFFWCMNVSMESSNAFMKVV